LNDNQALIMHGGSVICI